MTEEKHKRKYLRFKPEPMTIAYVDLKHLDKKQFEATKVGLVIDEAPMGGCSVVVVSDEELHPGRSCLIKVGELAPLPAKVVWRREFGEEIIKLGFEFLE